MKKKGRSGFDRAQDDLAAAGGVDTGGAQAPVADLRDQLLVGGIEGGDQVGGARAGRLRALRLYP